MTTTIDWSQYSTIHLGISGGKDSTAAWLWLLFESDCPREKIVGTFTDTQNEDPLTYAFLDLLAKLHPIETVATEGFFPLAKRKGIFPRRTARFCTEHLKVIPSIRRVLDFPSPRLCLSGIRKAEGHSSNDRGNLPEIEWSADYQADLYRPLYNADIDRVWELHRAYLSLADVAGIIDADPQLSTRHKSLLIRRQAVSGIPRNPLYDMGATRVGCFPCINSRKQEVRELARFRPQRVDEIREWEQEISDPTKGVSTFFAPKTTPGRFHSEEYTDKHGEVIGVCGIDDVVRWSRTTRGGKQFELDFEEDFVPPCVIGGHCE